MTLAREIVPTATDGPRGHDGRPLRAQHSRDRRRPWRVHLDGLQVVSRGAPWFPRSIRLRNGDIHVRRDWYETWLGELEQ